MIKVNNLSKSFDNLEVLKNFSFEVNKGDVIAILGPSGSGKTTLLRCMNFLEKADEGTIDFEGDLVDIKTVSNKKISEIRKRTGFVFQSFNLFLNKTALQNVIEGLIVARKMDKNEAEKIGKKMLDKVGLSDKYDYYPSQLSGGQQQRVAIARALACNPEIIYFDEPTSALDPETISEVLNVIKDLADEGMTMLIVTHEMNFAKNVSNRVLFIENGNIIKDTSTKDFFFANENERIQSFIKSLGENR
ncbi:MAG: amino acid ABC transporter ATP-binding protein [Erysipelotrichaceae bacterium]|nr:amino acid ABC transporter ATP-binding protein [Erysipelotrichaceae bacterium]